MYGGQMRKEILMFNKISIIFLFTFALLCFSLSCPGAALKGEPLIQENRDELIISNAYFQYRLFLKNGLYLNEIINKYSQDEITRTTPLRI